MKWPNTLNRADDRVSQMAISNYLGGFILLLVSYPFIFVFIEVFFYKPTRGKILFWFNVFCALLALFLIVLHMGIEVIFGKELLDAYYFNHSSE